MIQSPIREAPSNIFRDSSRGNQEAAKSDSTAHSPPSTPPPRSARSVPASAPPKASVANSSDTPIPATLPALPAPGQVGLHTKGDGNAAH